MTHFACKELLELSDRVKIEGIDESARVDSTNPIGTGHIQYHYTVDPRKYMRGRYQCRLASRECL